MAGGCITYLFLINILFFPCTPSMVEGYASIVISFFLFGDIASFVVGLYTLLHLHIQAKEWLSKIVLPGQFAFCTSFSSRGNSVWVQSSYACRTSLFSSGRKRRFETWQYKFM